VLLHVKHEAIVQLRRGVGELARVRTDQADLDGLLGLRGDGRQHDGNRGVHGEQRFTHRFLLGRRPAGLNSGGLLQLLTLVDQIGS